MSNKRVIIYCRISDETELHDVEKSLSNQESRCSQYLKLHKPNAEVEILKEAKSGGSISTRPVFMQILEEVKNGNVSAICSTRLDRLFRNTKNAIDTIDLLRQHNTELILVDQHIDTSTAMGRMFFIIISAMGALEREQVSERMVAAISTRTSRGLYIGGVTPFGFDKDPDHPGVYKENKEEAITVRSIYNLYLKLGSYQAVVDELNKRGIKNKNSYLEKNADMKWNTDSVMVILTNVKYIGKVELNKKNQKKDQSSLKENEKYALINAKWEGIVPIELWDNVQVMIAKNKRTRSNNIKKFREGNIYLFSGLIHCGKCNKPMSGFEVRNGKETEKIGNREIKSFKYHYEYYYCTHCKRRVKVAEYDLKIKEALHTLLNKEEYRGVVEKALKNGQDKLKKMIQETKNEIKALERSMKKNDSEVYDLTLALGKMTVPEVIQNTNKKLFDLTEQIIWDRNLLLGLKDNLEYFEDIHYNELFVDTTLIEKIFSGDMTEEEQKQIFHQLIDKVILHDKRTFSINLKIAGKPQTDVFYKASGVSPFEPV